MILCKWWAYFQETMVYTQLEILFRGLYSFWKVYYEVTSLFHRLWNLLLVKFSMTFHLMNLKKNT